MKTFYSDVPFLRYGNVKFHDGVIEVNESKEEKIKDIPSEVATIKDSEGEIVNETSEEPEVEESEEKEKELEEDITLPTVEDDREDIVEFIKEKDLDITYHYNRTKEENLEKIYDYYNINKERE